MSNEIGELLQAGKVRVFGREGEAFRLCGLDVIHGEIHMTVMPVNKPTPPVKEPTPEPPTKGWTVVVVDGHDLDGHAAPTLAEALELAHPDRGAVIVVWEVAAPDAGAARITYATGKRLFQFAWLGA